MNIAPSRQAQGRGRTCRPAGSPSRPAARREAITLVGRVEALDAHAIALLPEQDGGEPQLGEPPRHGVEDPVPGGLALDAGAQPGQPLEPLQVAGARRHVHELEEQLLGAERCDVQLEGEGPAARRRSP